METFEHLGIRLPLDVIRRQIGDGWSKQDIAVPSSKRAMTGDALFLVYTPPFGGRGISRGGLMYHVQRDQEHDACGQGGTRSGRANATVPASHYPRAEITMYFHVASKGEWTP
jgi:hypothetical protein